MFKEYQLEQYNEMKEDIINSGEFTRKIVLTGDLGTDVLVETFMTKLYEGKELVDMVRKSYDPTAPRSGGYVGMFCGASVYDIPDFPEKFSLIMEAMA